VSLSGICSFLVVGKIFKADSGQQISGMTTGFLEDSGFHRNGQVFPNIFLQKQIENSTNFCYKYTHL